MSLEPLIAMDQRNGWDPANTRIFDVYIQDGGVPDNGSQQLEDVFAYGARATASNTRNVGTTTASPESGSVSGCDSESESDSDVSSDIDDPSLINTGTGQRMSLSPSSVTHGYVPRPHVKPPRLDLAGGGSGGPVLGQVLGQGQGQGQGPVPISDQGQAQPHVQNLPHLPLNMQLRQEPTVGTQSAVFMTTPSSAPAGMHALANTDIWSSPVENAFLAALRIIMKNGTSKIKLRDRNYGRNELISLFIRHNVGEHRTKKQISSHIQVWKKSIVSKLHNNLELSPYEGELLELIENGARQTQENKITFNKVFCEMLDSGGTNHSRSRTRSSDSGQIVPPSSSSGASLVAGVAYSSADHSLEPAMDQVLANTGRPLVTAPARFSDQPLEVVREPQTPLEYAKRVYSNLRSYKCVPVNMQEYAPHPQEPTPISALADPLELEGNTPLTCAPDNRALQAAKEIEQQQRRLIQSLYATPASSDAHRSFVSTDHPSDKVDHAPSSQQLNTPYIMSTQHYNNSSETFKTE